VVRFVPATASSGLIKDSGADAFQVKSLSENRFVRRLGNVTADQMTEIASAIALVRRGSIVAISLREMASVGILLREMLASRREREGRTCFFSPMRTLWPPYAHFRR
jgi:hypothetical protein